MKAYQYHVVEFPRLNDCAMLFIGENDPMPTNEELEEGEQLSRLLLLGDSSVRLLPSDRHPDIFNVVRVGPATLKAAA